MNKYVELSKDKINFAGDTEAEKKANEMIYDLSLENDKLQQENKQLGRQLEYLRSGEYYNQLRFERDMLQDLVDNREVSKKDRQFIDMTHRNTELLEQLKQRDEVIDETIKFVKSLSSKGRDCMIYTDIKKDILNKLQKYKGDNSE